MKKSLQTITSEFLEDMSQVTLQKLSKEKFMRKYGHLRPELTTLILIITKK